MEPFTIPNKMSNENSEIGFRFFDEMNTRFEQLGERMEVYGCAFRALDELNMHYGLLIDEWSVFPMEKQNDMRTKGKYLMAQATCHRYGALLLAKIFAQLTLENQQQQQGAGSSGSSLPMQIDASELNPDAKEFRKSSQTEQISIENTQSNTSVDAKKSTGIEATQTSENEQVSTKNTQSNMRVDADKSTDDQVIPKSNETIVSSGHNSATGTIPKYRIP